MPFGGVGKGRRRHFCSQRRAGFKAAALWVGEAFLVFVIKDDSRLLEEGAFLPSDLLGPLHCLHRRGWWIISREPDGRVEMSWAYSTA